MTKTTETKKTLQQKLDEILATAERAAAEAMCEDLVATFTKMASQAATVFSNIPVFDSTSEVAEAAAAGPVETPPRRARRRTKKHTKPVATSRAQQSAALLETENEICRMIENNPHLRPGEMRRQLGLSEDRWKYATKSLRDKRMIEMFGVRPNISYRVTDPKAETEKVLGQDSKVVLDFVRKNPGCNAVEMRSVLNLTRNTFERAMRPLRTFKLVIKHGDKAFSTYTAA